MKGMKKKGRGMEKGKRMKQMIIVALIAVAFVAPASAATLTVTPHTITSPQLVEIEGTGFGNGEEVTITCNVTGFKIPVSADDGKYAHSLVDFNISNENTDFSLEVREVKNDMVIKVKRAWYSPYWTLGPEDKLGFDFTRTGATNTSRVTKEGAPKGIYCVITVTGTAVAAPTVAGYVENVTLNASVTLEVIANGTGGFKEVIDTHGLPNTTTPYTINATSATVPEGAEATLNLSLNGDANKDGDVGAYDCCCIARYVVGIPGYDNSTMLYDAMTVDEVPLGDPGVTIEDAKYLAEYLVGIQAQLH